MTISFEDRKEKMNKGNVREKSLEERWDEIDADSAARGAAILVNGSADFGKLNCSLTAENDVKEFEKQASVHAELFEKLNNYPEARKAAAELHAMLDEIDEADLDNLDEEEE